MQTFLLFSVFVAIAVYVQSLTGFALALVLLGLVGATDLVPLPDVVNVVSVIGLCNAALFLYRRGALRLERLLWPALLASQIGTVLGLVVLTWMVGSAYEFLRLLLGVSVILCALMLWCRAKPREQPSTPASFVLISLFSGLMGGLFAAAGPPLVYQFYRQPWSLAKIQDTLVFFFGAGAILRLAIVIPTGGISLVSLHLMVVAIPIVFMVTLLTAKRRAPLPDRLVQRLVCVLLLVTGTSMIYTAARVLALT